MKKATELHLDKYPSKPADLKKWVATVEELFEEYRRTIGFDKGEKVKW